MHRSSTSLSWARRHIIFFVTFRSSFSLLFPFDGLLSILSSHHFIINFSEDKFFQFHCLFAGSCCGFSFNSVNPLQIRHPSFTSLYLVNVNGIRTRSVRIVFNRRLIQRSQKMFSCCNPFFRNGTHR